MEDFIKKKKRNTKIIDLEKESKKIGRAEEPPPPTPPEIIHVEEVARRLGNVEMYLISRK